MKSKRNLKRNGILAAGLVSALSFAGCAPLSPASVGGIRCEGGSGQFDLSPALTTVENPASMTLAAQSSVLGCVDGSGTGITSAVLEDASIGFASLSCYISPGTTGTGSAKIRWSDGTTSNASLIGKLDGGALGSLELSVTSGHFTGMAGSTPFVVSATGGSCFGSGITGLSVGFQSISVAPA